MSHTESLTSTPENVLGDKDPVVAAAATNSEEAMKEPEATKGSEEQTTKMEEAVSKSPMTEEDIPIVAATTTMTEEIPIVAAATESPSELTNAEMEDASQEPEAAKGSDDVSQPPAETQTSSKKSKVDVSNLPTRQYLDQTVVPILLQGLSWLAKTRPDDPIVELSKYLIEHKPEHDLN